MQNLTFEQLPDAVTQLGKKLDNIERLLQQQNEQKSTVQVGDLLTVNKAAEFLSLATPTIYTKVSKGELPFMKRGKRLYFSREDLTAYLRAGRKSTNDEILEGAGQYIVNKRR